MAIRKNLNQLKNELNSKIKKSGNYFIDRQPADLGNNSGVVKVPDTENMVYARLENGQIVEVFNNVAPNIYNWKVFVGRDKSQPTLFKVLEVRWVYNIAQTVAYVLFHHRQHEYPNPDTVWIMRDQFMPLLVLPNGGFNVMLFGDTVYQPGMASPIRVVDTALDLSAYVNSTGANYVLIELDTSGAINYVVGSDYGDIISLRISAPIPTPTEGNFPICAIEFYAGQTGIRRDSTDRNIIDLRMFTSNVVPTVGTQINDAPTDTPLAADLFGFWDVIDSALKSITLTNFLLVIKSFTDTLYSALGHTHTGDEITLDTSSFDNRLDDTVTDVQLLAEAVDELTSTVPVTTVSEHEFLQIEVPGALAVAADICPRVLIVSPTVITKVYILCNAPGSAGSTIVDIHLEGTGTIWTTTANRPELDNTDTYNVSGAPDIDTFSIGDVLSVHIDQIATDAADLRIVLVEETDELVFSDHALVTTEV